MNTDTIVGDTYALRAVECDACEGRGQHNGFVTYAGEAHAGEPTSSRCEDCHGEGEFPATCDTCGKEVPLNDAHTCAVCNGEA